MSDTGFVDHCLELLSPLGATRARRMFGGYGLYVDDLCIALIIRDVFYLKVDDAHRASFEAAHGKPFTYTGKNDETHMLSYYTVPEEAMESPAEMTPWARRALAAAVAARAKAPPKKASVKKAAVKKTGGPGAEKTADKTTKKAPKKPASTASAATKTPARKPAATRAAASPTPRPRAKKA